MRLPDYITATNMRVEDGVYKCDFTIKLYPVDHVVEERHLAFFLTHKALPLDVLTGSLILYPDGEHPEWNLPLRCGTCGEPITQVRCLEDDRYAAY